MQRAKHQLVTCYGTDSVEVFLQKPFCGAANLLQQRVVEALDQVGVLHVTAQELGVLHADVGDVALQRHIARDNAGQISVDALVVRVDTLPPLLCSIPVALACGKFLSA